MTILTPEKLNELYRKLPEDVSDLYASDTVGDTIREIGKKYNVKKIEGLVDETGLVMLGFTHPKDYIRNLSTSLEIDTSEAKKIAEEINIQVFQAIKESLKKIHAIGGASKQSDTPPQKETPATDTISTPPSTPEEKVVEKSAFAEALEKKTKSMATTPLTPTKIPVNNMISKTARKEKKGSILEEKLTSTFRIPKKNEKHEKLKKLWHERNIPLIHI